MAEHSEHDDLQPILAVDVGVDDGENDAPACFRTVRKTVTVYRLLPGDGGIRSVQPGVDYGRLSATVTDRESRLGVLDLDEFNHDV